MPRPCVLVASACLLVACHRPAPGGPAPAQQAGPSAGAPAVEDLSGRWACEWNLPGASGDESWTLMQDGAAVTVTLRGNDPGGSYTGSMSGTLSGRSLELAYRFNDGTRGTLHLKASANGKVLDGESVRASAKARPQHYACSRDDGTTPRAGRRRGGGGSSSPTGECTKHTGVAYLEDCQQACWAAGSLGEGKCREKCTAYCKPRP